MTKDDFHPSLPQHLIRQLKSQAGSQNAERAWPAGETYSGSKFLGHVAESVLFLWRHSPYTCPVSHHIAFVDADGTVWFRALQLLIPQAVRKRFPYSMSMKDEKARYYRGRFQDAERVREMWRVFHVALWSLDDAEAQSLELGENEKAATDGHLTQREALFRIPEVRAADATDCDPDGITTKRVDTPLQTQSPVLREIIVGLKDYAQKKGDATTLLEHDRLEFPVAFPSRNMAISLVIDQTFLGRHTDLDMELRNDEMARFGGEDPPPYEFWTESLGRFIPDSGNSRSGQRSRGLDMLLARLRALEVSEKSSLPEHPEEYAFFRFVCPWPILGQQMCVRWKLPD